MLKQKLDYVNEHPLRAAAVFESRHCYYAALWIIVQIERVEYLLSIYSAKAG